MPLSKHWYYQSANLEFKTSSANIRHLILYPLLWPFTQKHSNVAEEQLNNFLCVLETL